MNKAGAYWVIAVDRKFYSGGEAIPVVVSTREEAMRFSSQKDAQKVARVLRAKVSVFAKLPDAQDFTGIGAITVKKHIDG